MNNLVYMKVLGKWMFYATDQVYKVNPVAGEWLIFFGEQSYKYISNLCQMAVEQGYVKQAKHNSLEDLRQHNHGVACFRIDNANGINRQEHIRLLKFLKNNRALKINKNGKYVNIRFKEVSDGTGTHKGHEWNGFTLDAFMDLNTGEFYEG